MLLMNNSVNSAFGNFLASFESWRCHKSKPSEVNVILPKKQVIARTAITVARADLRIEDPIRFSAFGNSPNPDGEQLDSLTISQIRYQSSAKSAQPTAPMPQIILSVGDCCGVGEDSLARR